MMRREFLQYRVIKIIEGVRANDQNPHKSQSENPRQEIAVYHVRSFFPFPSTDLSQRRASSLLHELLHIGELLS